MPAIPAPADPSFPNMYHKFTMLSQSLLLALGVAATGASAQQEPSHERFGIVKPVYTMTNIQVRNLQDEKLGRIKEMGIDLINGRIVVVLVTSDASLEDGAKIVAIPPGAFVSDALNEVYRVDISTDTFRSAASVDVKHWADYGHSSSIATTYRLFGQEPYFLEEGVAASKTDQRPKVALGYVERSSRILDMPVENFQKQKFGKVWSMTLDIPTGRILNVIVLAPGNFQTKSIIPAMALAFNPARDGLLLDDSKMEYADEPRYVFTAPAYGQDASSKEESYQGPHTGVALEQGTSYRDVDRTVLINQEVRVAKINGRNVQVGTINGRVTLRGWVHTDDDKRRIGEIAIAASRLELVDNQISVGKPVKQ